MQASDLAVNKDFIKGREPKILCLDLEISPMLAYTYEAYEGNALKIKVLPQIVAFAYSWNDEKEIHVRMLPDYHYKSGILNMNDKHLVEELHDIMHEADVIYGHNIRAFDMKHARARFLVHKLPVTKKWITEDTLTMARKYFKFPKNNLDFLTEQLGIGTKTKVKHSDVIWDCIEGDMGAWKSMKEYVKNDIAITKPLYKELAPWHETHYNLNLIRRNGNSCPLCGHTKTHRRGYQHLPTGLRQKYACLSCGKWWTGEYVARALDGTTEAVIQRNP